MLNTNPRNYVMRDYASRDERSAGVMLLGRQVDSPLENADAGNAASQPEEHRPGRLGSVVTALAGLLLGVALVAWLASQ